MGKRARDRRAARREARAERKRIKQEGRTARATGRQESKAAAYKAGIDPGAKWTGLIGKGLDIAGSKFGGKTPPQKNTGEASSSMGNMLPLILGAAALFFLKGKK